MESFITLVPVQIFTNISKICFHEVLRIVTQEFCKIVAKHVGMRMNVAAPEKLKNLRPTKFD